MINAKLFDEIAKRKTQDIKLWTSCYDKADKDVSDEHSILCVCGQLCTGLHENFCKKFREKVYRRANQYFDEETKKTKGE